MTFSRAAIFAAALALSAGALFGSSQQASAGGLDFLNHMNPKYTQCTSNVTAQLAPQYRNDRKVHDSVITACNARYPAFGR